MILPFRAQTVDVYFHAGYQFGVLLTLVNWNFHAYVGYLTFISYE